MKYLKLAFCNLSINGINNSWASSCDECQPSKISVYYKIVVCMVSAFFSAACNFEACMYTTLYTVMPSMTLTFSGHSF